MTATLRSSRSLFPDAKLGDAFVALKASILYRELDLQQVILEVGAVLYLGLMRLLALKRS